MKVRQANKIVDSFLHRRGRWKGETIANALRVCGRRGKYRRESGAIYDMSPIMLGVARAYRAIETFARHLSHVYSRAVTNLFCPPRRHISNEFRQ
jgi:hypothetical protein